MARPMRAGTHTGRPVNGSEPRVAVRAIAPRTPPLADCPPDGLPV
jgi:hypothetical protein